MAEGFINGLIDDRYEAWSAGTEPSEVNPYAIKVMEEIGINISSHYAKSVGEFLEMEFDYVVTVCDHAKGLVLSYQAGKRCFIRVSRTRLPLKAMKRKKSQPSGA